MRRAFWLVVIVVLLGTRVPAASHYFSIDNVNLALSLESFDPLRHQPQPPGYPLFVASARVVNFFLRDPARTFKVIAWMVSLLCLPIAAAIGRRVSGVVAVGDAAVWLLLLNPIFWEAGLSEPLRGFLALFSLLTGYCTWRAWNGETQWVFLGACSIAVGTGFRPDLLPVLLPIWFVSAAVGTRSWKKVALGTLVLGALTLVWVTGLAIACGGFGQMIQLNASYLQGESHRAGGWAFGASWDAVQRQLGRLSSWNLLAILGWVWVVPFAFRAPVNASGKRALSFFAVWLIPGLALQALIHVEDAPHTLFSIPVFCILGGWAIDRASRRLAPLEPSRLSSSLLSAALLFNLMMFLNFFVSTGSDAGGLKSLKNAFVFEAFSASLADVRWLDEVSDSTMREFRQIKPNDRPWIVVSTDDDGRKDWFMNWRIFRYYAPDAEIWVAANRRSASLMRRDQTLEFRDAKDGPIPIPVPRGGRVIWLLENHGALHRDLVTALSGTRQLQSGTRLLYTDIADTATPFQAWGYEFVPTSASSPSQ